MNALNGFGSCVRCHCPTFHGRHLDPDLERVGQFCDLAVLLRVIREQALAQLAARGARP